MKDLSDKQVLRNFAKGAMGGVVLITLITILAVFIASSAG